MTEYLPEKCGMCSSSRWCGRQCGTWAKLQAAKAQVTDPPEQDEAAFKKAKMKKMPAAPKRPKRDVADIADPFLREAVIEKLQDTASSARPPAHPDCERCKYDNARAADKMRKRRGR